jgi:hypothetical protein
MDSNDTTERLPWETPIATAITDIDSRADEPDITTGNANGPAIS